MSTYAEAVQRMRTFAPALPADEVFVARVRAELKDARSRALQTIPGGRPTLAPVAPPRRRKYPSRWTREKIRQAILRWVREYGRTPTSKDWQRSGEWWPCHVTVVTVYGGWSNAIEEAGFARPASRGRRRVVASPS